MREGGRGQWWGLLRFGRGAEVSMETPRTEDRNRGRLEAPASGLVGGTRYPGRPLQLKIRERLRKKEARVKQDHEGPQGRGSPYTVERLGKCQESPPTAARN